MLPRLPKLDVLFIFFCYTCLIVWLKVTQKGTGSKEEGPKPGLGRGPGRLCVSCRNNHTPTRAPSFTLRLRKSTGLPATSMPSSAQVIPPRALLAMTCLHAGLLASRTASDRLNIDCNEQALGPIKPRLGLMRDRCFFFFFLPWQLKTCQLCHFLRPDNSNGPHTLSGNCGPVTMLVQPTHVIPASATHPTTLRAHVPNSWH